MKVLDIDMDFFLNKILNWGTFDENRLSDDEYLVWSYDSVRKFLENNCALRTDRKVRGQLFVHHKEVFYFWRQLIYSYALTIPFDVIHIDAHADLGGGDAGWKFIFEELLSLPIDERYHVEKYKYRNSMEHLDSGNYLLYALACNWINSLTYVHPSISDGRDYYPSIMKDCDDNSGYIQLKQFHTSIDPNIKILKQKFEPVNEVKFVTLNSTEYVNSNSFDFITFSQSPSFTPKSADFIIDIMKEYIDFI